MPPAPGQSEDAWLWKLPRGFPVPRVPADNPMSLANVELGRRLFYDVRLSVTGGHACASCHEQARAFTDGRARAVGATGELHPRSSMSLANVAYNPSFGWADPGLRSLEAQASVPMLGETPVELGLQGREREVMGRLRRDPVYARLFPRAFPAADDPFDFAHVAKALAAFQRTLVSGESPYDRLVYHDERDALSVSARRGMRIFFSDRVGCAGCHGGLTFSGPIAYRDVSPEAVLHNTGLYDLDGRGLYPEGGRGLFEHTGRPEDMGRFRAPTLRNIAVTAPYMHDGSLATLREVLDHYAAGGRTSNPHKSPRLAAFPLGPDEAAALIAFLQSLTDPTFLTNADQGDPW